MHEGLSVCSPRDAVMNTNLLRPFALNTTSNYLSSYHDHSAYLPPQSPTKGKGAGTPKPARRRAVKAEEEEEEEDEPLAKKKVYVFDADNI